MLFIWRGGHLDFILCTEDKVFYFEIMGRTYNFFFVCWCWQMCCKLREHARTATTSTRTVISVGSVLILIAIRNRARDEACKPS